jgi:Holliday junction resolvase-like predicted endonuclease
MALARDGERQAEQYLVRHGATVLERNYRTPYGAADLMVSHEGELVIVQVKTTSTGAPSGAGASTW